MTYVTIQAPQQIPAGTGVTAARSGGAAFCTRFAIDEHMLIDNQCARLEMSKSNFIRWCAIMVAKALEAQHEHDHDRPKEN